MAQEVTRKKIVEWVSNIFESSATFSVDVFAVYCIRDVKGQRLASKGGRQRRGGGARVAGRVH